KTEEPQPQDKSRHKVYRPREPDKGREQAHCQQCQTVSDHMAPGARTLKINHWQDAKASAGVIVTVESGNGQRVGKLPQKQHGKQHPSLTPKAPTCPPPAHHGW